MLSKRSPLCTLCVAAASQSRRLSGVVWALGTARNRTASGGARAGPATSHARSVSVKGGVAARVKPISRGPADAFGVWAPSRGRAGAAARVGRGGK